MTPENWANIFCPNLKENVRSVLHQHVGRNCDVPFMLRQILLIVREEWGTEHEQTRSTETGKEGYQEKIAASRFNSREF